MKTVVLLFIVLFCVGLSLAQKQKHSFPACTKQPKDWCSKSGCKVWYVDPVKGSNSNDGSKEKPWKSVEDVLETKTSKYVIDNWDETYPIKSSQLKAKNTSGKVKGGDVIVLLAGSYPQINIKNTYNKKRIFITSLPGSKVTVDLLRIYSAANITVACLNITSVSQQSATDQTLVTLGGSKESGPAVDIYLDSNIIYSFADIFKYKSSASSLNKYAGQGIAVNDFGYYNRLARNYIYNVRRGIIFNSPYNYAGYNTVNYVFGDSFRVLHNHSHVEYNLAQNIMNVDNNKDHRDGIQLFTKSNKNSLTDILINNNKFIADVDKARPFPAQFQGISSFDVPISKVRVINNLISTGHYNGIVLAKSTDCQVIGNTLVDPTERFILWISFPYGKKGNIVLNNIAERAEVWEGIKTEGGNYFANLDAKKQAKWFKDPAKQNWKLKNVAGSPLIGKGVDSNLDLKLAGVAGNKADIGCYNLEDSKKRAIDTQ